MTILNAKPNLLTALIQIDTDYACAGVIVKNGRVVEAAPIFYWMVGKPWDKVRHFRKIKSIRIQKEGVWHVLDRNYKCRPLAL